MEPYTRHGAIKISRKGVKDMFKSKKRQVLAVEPKAIKLPETIPCTLCGAEMEFVNDNLMYSCPTPGCAMNLSEYHEEA